MEKGQGFSGSSAPPPSAPPSYDEAVASGGSGAPYPQTSNAPYPPTGAPYPPAGNTPYPITDTAMPMPSSYGHAAMAMPMPHSQPHIQVNQQANLPQFTPQPYAAPQSYAPPQEVRVIHQQVTYALGPNPVKLSCPSCHADVKTTTVSDHQPSAHICCIILCLLGCGLCSCLPYCMSAFMSVHHSCPNCKTYIGTWKG